MWHALIITTVFIVAGPAAAARGPVWHFDSNQDSDFPSFVSHADINHANGIGVPQDYDWRSPSRWERFMEEWRRY